MTTMHALVSGMCDSSRKAPSADAPRLAAKPSKTDNRRAESPENAVRQILTQKTLSQ